MYSERRPSGDAQADPELASTYADVRRLPIDVQRRIQVVDRGEANCPAELLGSVLTALAALGLPVRAIGGVRERGGRTLNGDYASYEGFSVEESLRWVRPGLQHVRSNDCSCYVVWWTSEDMDEHRFDAD
jgi:hypothetical protein